MEIFIKTTKILRKPVVSTPLNSIDFNASQLLRYVMPRWEVNDVCL